MENWTIDGCLELQNVDIVCPAGRIAMLDCENESVPDESIMARARLIAAAPDLLAALNAALDDVDSDRAQGYEPPEWYWTARAAIAKTAA